jgi:hypothetical protein
LWGERGIHDPLHGSVPVELGNQHRVFGVKLLFQVLEFLARILEERLAVNHE